ncbi:hypothetical protein AYI68_g6625 [Smittium mucronatum]|uniref:Uncharacterized protein n=1 Tax=Smittium mucronatum TaxID=133383 RepID=A0A1R0GQZ5_9FUNG|nr:hypothetical protein AYI68_g6625 [Smittium mucronatum]
MESQRVGDDHGMDQISYSPLTVPIISKPPPKSFQKNLYLFPVQKSPISPKPTILDWSSEYNTETNFSNSKFRGYDTSSISTDSTRTSQWNYDYLKTHRSSYNVSPNPYGIRVSPLSPNSIKPEYRYSYSGSITKDAKADGVRISSIWEKKNEIQTPDSSFHASLEYGDQTQNFNVSNSTIFSDFKVSKIAKHLPKHINLSNENNDSSKPLRKISSSVTNNPIANTEMCASIGKKNSSKKINDSSTFKTSFIVDGGVKEATKGVPKKARVTSLRSVPKIYTPNEPNGPQKINMFTKPQAHNPLTKGDKNEELENEKREKDIKNNEVNKYRLSTSILDFSVSKNGIEPKSLVDELGLEQPAIEDAKKGQERIGKFDQFKNPRLKLPIHKHHTLPNLSNETVYISKLNNSVILFEPDSGEFRDYSYCQPQDVKRTSFFQIQDSGNTDECKSVSEQDGESENSLVLYNCFKSEINPVVKKVIKIIEGSELNSFSKFDSEDKKNGVNPFEHLKNNSAEKNSDGTNIEQKFKEFSKIDGIESFEKTKIDEPSGKINIGLSEMDKMVLFLKNENFSDILNENKKYFKPKLELVKKKRSKLVRKSKLENKKASGYEVLPSPKIEKGEFADIENSVKAECLGSVSNTFSVAYTRCMSN